MHPVENANLIAPYIVALLGGVFFVSGVSKIVARERFSQSLRELGLVHGRVETVVRTLLPISEIGIAFLLFLTRPWSLRVGAAACLVFLLLFIAVALFAIRRGKTGVECACFGPLSHSTFGAALIVRNTVLSVLALYVAALSAVLSTPSEPLLNWHNIVPIILPMLAIFPVYALSRYFLANSDYYARPHRPQPLAGSGNPGTS